MKKSLSLSFAAAATLMLSSCGGAPADSAVSPDRPVLQQPVAGQICLGMIEIKIEQSTFTLDPIQHMKDNANATRLTMPVLPSDYARLREGAELSSDFRSGSFWLGNGQISSRDITVTRKVGYICEAPAATPSAAPARRTP